MLETLKDALSPHERTIEKLKRLRDARAAEGAARARTIAAAQAEVDALDAPRRRLEKLNADNYVAGLAADREIGVIENELRDPANWPRELRRLEVDLERFRDEWAPAVPPAEEHNRITGATLILNLLAIEQRAAAIDLWRACAAELRSTLWQLDRAALQKRIAEIRSALAQYDTLLGADEGDGAA